MICKLLNELGDCSMLDIPCNEVCDSDCKHISANAKNQAYWIHAKGKNNVWYCSECGEKILYNPTRRTYRPIKKPDVSEINKFCRGCGRRMIWSRYADKLDKSTP